MKKKWLVDCWEQTVLQLSSIYRNQKRSLQYRCCATLQIHRKIKKNNNSLIGSSSLFKSPTQDSKCTQDRRDLITEVIRYVSAK